MARMGLVEYSYTIGCLTIWIVATLRCFAVIISLLFVAGCGGSNSVGSNSGEECNLEGSSLSAASGVSNTPVVTVRVDFDDDSDVCPGDNYCECSGPSVTAFWNNETTGATGASDYTPRYICNDDYYDSDLYSGRDCDWDGRWRIAIPLTAGENRITVEATVSNLPESDSVAVYYDPVPPPAAEVEPNDTRTQAQPITVPGTVTGTVDSDTDTADYYVFSAEQDSAYCVELSSVSEGGFADLCILRGDDDDICEINQNSAVGMAFVSFTALQSHLVVQPWSTTEYHLYVSAPLPLNRLYRCP